jgi:hypothetical protein
MSRSSNSSSTSRSSADHLLGAYLSSKGGAARPHCCHHPCQCVMPVAGTQQLPWARTAWLDRQACCCCSQPLTCCGAVLEMSVHLQMEMMHPCNVQQARPCSGAPWFSPWMCLSGQFASRSVAGCYPILDTLLNVLQRSS